MNHGITTASTRTGNSAALHCQPVMRSVVEDASRPRQRAADSIHWPFGAKRLTTSGFSSQSR